MDNQELAFNRLLKKLSALRATLKSDERNLLDGLITGPVDEVAAHAMHISTAKAAAKSAAKAASPDEARANAMHISTAKSAAKSTAKAASPDEARANAMAFRIIFNEDKDEYQRLV
jgi:FixJ family two-component response regulator